MKLVKFRIKSIDESKTETEAEPLYFDSSFKLTKGKPYIDVRYQYKITDTEDKVYHIGMIGSSKPLNLSLISDAMNGSNEYRIEWPRNRKFKGYFLTPKEFKDAIEDYKSREMESIKFHRTEYDRLESLK